MGRGARRRRRPTCSFNRSNSDSRRPSFALPPASSLDAPASPRAGSRSQLRSTRCSRSTRSRGTRFRRLRHRDLDGDAGEVVRRSVRRRQTVLIAPIRAERSPNERHSKEERQQLRHADAYRAIHDPTPTTSFRHNPSIRRYVGRGVWFTQTFLQRHATCSPAPTPAGAVIGVMQTVDPLAYTTRLL